MPDGCPPLPPAARRKAGDHSTPCRSAFGRGRCATQRNVNRSSRGPRPAHAAALQPVPQSSFARGQGRRVAHASACAGARSARPDQKPASPPQGAAGQGHRGGEPTVFHSSFVPSTAPPVLAAAAASPHPRTARRPARSRRAPAAHRSREACRPACQSVRAPQVAALNGSAILLPLTAGDAAGPGPRSHCRRSTARAQAVRKMPVHSQARLGFGRAPCQRRRAQT